MDNSYQLRFEKILNKLSLSQLSNALYICVNYCLCRVLLTRVMIIMMMMMILLWLATVSILVFTPNQKPNKSTSWHPLPLQCGCLPCHFFVFLYFLPSPSVILSIVCSGQGVDDIVISNYSPFHLLFLFIFNPFSPVWNWQQARTPIPNWWRWVKILVKMGSMKMIPWETKKMKEKTNATNATMPLLGRVIWEDIWKRTVEKSQTNVTNVTLHLLMQALWGCIWKHTAEKSQTNATNATMPLLV